jgi:hypothetical protein
MVPYQLKKENFIPLIVLLAGSALLFGFLALPYSHFDVLGLMQAMQTADSDSHLAALGSLTILPDCPDCRALRHRCLSLVHVQTISLED